MIKFKYGDMVRLTEEAKLRFNDSFFDSADDRVKNHKVLNVLNGSLYDIGLSQAWHESYLELVVQDTKKGHKEGLTNRTDKPRLSFIPKEAMWEMGKALTKGEEKYGAHNFKKGLPVTYLADGAMRHILQGLNDEDIDEETQAHHFGCAMANLAMALYQLENNPDMDDRYKKETSQK